MTTAKSYSSYFYVVYLKSLCDFLLASVLLMLLSPLFIVLTLTLAIQYSGSPFFSQERLGKNESLFKLLKFRTFKREGDHQSIGKFGRFLRGSSLDELPQLLNVLNGDLSFVGPRPLLKEYKDYYNKEERRRHAIKPGITGLAQIKIGNSPDWDKRMSYDLAYVQKVSFMMDMRLMLQTFSLAFSMKLRTDADQKIERFDEFVQKRQNVKSIK